ncbi:MAG TPA: STT3 domain-containing protein [Thermoanaerobaculia bacterium]|nr:STT3 domain-containing protein [Thermoanaerobaculia bacterium]
MKRFADLAAAAAFAAAAFLLRVLPGAADVVGGPSVRFRSPDPLYHMRMADLLLDHAFRPVRHDPMLLWPRGQDVASGPLWDYLIAGPAFAIGRGHPTRHLLDLWGAFLPPILGALLAAAYWLLLRRPFGRPGAALSAALVVVMPGQLLHRTALGYTDHHAIALLSLGLFLLFLVRAAAERNEIRARREAVAAGVGLALLVLSWPWGAAFAGVAALWAVIDGVFRSGSRALDRMARAAAVAALPVAAGALVFPVLRKPAAALVVVAAAAWMGARDGRRRAIVLCAAVVAAFAAAAVLTDLPRELVLRLRPSATRTTVGEAAPLLSTGPGVFPFVRELWTGVFAAAYGAGLAIRSLRSRAESGLLLVFAAVTLGLALLQTRFSGEAALVAAILAGFVPARLSAGTGDLSDRRERAGRVLVLAGLALLVVVPAALVAPKSVRGLPLEDPDWDAAMAWLRASTPDPFAPSGPDGTASYSVLSWWDNGYEIARNGHRVPVANPTQEGAGFAAKALLETDESAAEAMLRSRDVRYIALDANVPFFPEAGGRAFVGQFWALPVWAGTDRNRFYEKFPVPGAAGSETKIFFADYYRTLVYRLWRYGGASAPPSGPVAAIGPGEPATIRRFSGFEEADRFVAAAGTGWRLGCEDPITPCVPLAAWSRFRRAYSSPDDAVRGPEGRVARVEILAFQP